LNFQQFINILWAQKWIALTALIISVITTLLVSLSLPKQYTAIASIVVNQRSVNPITGLEMASQLLPGYMATQSDVIASHNVAFKVVEKLKLGDDPQMQKAFAKSKGIGDIKDWIADSLLINLEVKPSRESSLIGVGYTSETPESAAVIANAFTEAYIQTSIDLHAQPAKLSADWFDSQIVSLRERLERAQTALSTYQQQHGIIGTTDTFDMENTRLAELSRQLVESQSKTSELQSRKDLLMSTLKQGGSIQSMHEVLSNSLIQTLKSDLARSTADLAELSKRVDVNHPHYKQAKAEMSSMQQKLGSEINTIINGITNELESSSQRDHLIANALAEQKAKVLELKNQHDEISLLKPEVESAQKSYDAAMQRAGQTRMESEMSQTNISILNPAVPPQKPAKPNILLNIIVSIFLGGMLGVGSALVTEMMDRRVRSSFDISQGLGVSVFSVDTVLIPSVS